LGKQQIETDKVDREKYEYNIQVAKDNQKFIVHPVVFWSDFNQRQSPLFNPGIRNLIVKDVYVSPQGIGTDGGIPQLEIKKGMTEYDSLSGYKIKFIDFDFSSQQKAQMLQGGGAKIGAMLLLTARDGKTDSITLYSKFGGPNGPEPVPVMVPNTNITAYFVRPEPDRDHPENSKAIVALDDKDHPPPPLREVIAFDVSVKPFINLVWGGVIVMVLGFVFSIARRKKESDKELASRKDE
jgi:cytochrome c-type biogenesis protein CcmF